MIRPAIRRRLPWLVLAVLVCLVLASSVALAAPDMVQGNKVTVMGNSEVPADTTVTGDSVTVMGNTVINGTVMGNVASVMGNVEINGVVNGNVTAVMGNVDVRPGAQIHGQINVALGQVSRAPGVVIPNVQVDNGGVINLNGLDIHGLGGLGSLPLNLFRGIFGPWVVLSRWLIDLAIALVLVALFPAAIKGTAVFIDGDAGRAALAGLLALVVAVPVGILLLITIIGPVVWILFLITAVYFGKAAVAAILGRKIRAALQPAEAGQPSSLVVDVAIGVTLVALLGFVPVAGTLARLIVNVIGLGAILITRFGTNQPWFRRAA